MKAAAITCPVCGEANPADSELCRNCREPLASSRGAGHAPQIPTRAGRSPREEKVSGAEPPIPSWLREARQRALRDSPDAGKVDRPQQNINEDRAEDLLAGLANQAESGEHETPAWVARITGKGKGAKPPVADRAFGHLEPPGEAMAGDAGFRPAADSGPDELTAWFKQASGAAPGPLERGAVRSEADEREPVVAAAPGTSGEIDDWLKRLDASAASSAGNGAGGLDSVSQADVPDWVRNLGPRSASVREADSTPVAALIPEWLKDGDEARILSGHSSDAPVAPVADESTPGPAAAPSPSAAQQSGVRTAVMPEQGDGAEPAHGIPAFTPEALDGIDVDAIFASMQMPEWLSSAGTGAAAMGSLPPAAQEEEQITPAELPSWIQAMRPLESAVPGQAPVPADQRLEERGPLLGLHGVLPAVAGAAFPSSKPKVHSIKLDASPHQQSHAALLEEIIQAETTPVPMKGTSGFASQSILRWGISLVLVILLGGAVLTGSQIFPMPVAIPKEAAGAIQAVEAIPADAPVLVVFDYEPATAGEMEATAASLLDHMLLLRHPRVAMLSTSPTGPALADRFISTTLAARAYRSGAQYLNLGYLPGGLSGVHFFAEGPRAAMPLSGDGGTAWESPVLQDVARLSDFAAIIVLSDNTEAGRVWIEQTASQRRADGMIIVSSAQAGPILLPYADSRQVSGLIAGIKGAAGAEQANGGLPGFVRRYWDAYNLGLYAAVLWIVLGGARHFWLGLQERRTPAA